MWRQLYLFQFFSSLYMWSVLLWLNESLFLYKNIRSEYLTRYRLWPQSWYNKHGKIQLNHVTSNRRNVNYLQSHQSCQIQTRGYKQAHYSLHFAPETSRYTQYKFNSTLLINWNAHFYVKLHTPGGDRVTIDKTFIYTVLFSSNWR